MPDNSELAIRRRCNLENFEIGDQVEKKSGFRFPGVIVSRFQRLDGQIRYVVEAKNKDFAGMLHIYSGAELTKTEILRGPGCAEINFICVSCGAPPGGKCRNSPQKQGGLARAASLSPETRSAIAKKAADARWKKERGENYGQDGNA